MENKCVCQVVSENIDLLKRDLYNSFDCCRRIYNATRGQMLGFFVLLLLIEVSSIGGLVFGRFLLIEINSSSVNLESSFKVQHKQQLTLLDLIVLINCSLFFLLIQWNHLLIFHQDLQLP